MTPEQRAAARKRCEAATEPPWLVGVASKVLHYGCCPYDGHCRNIYAVDADGEYAGDITSPCAGLSHPNATFAAHARTDLPAALSEIDRLEALLRQHGIDPNP
jgi:hypothetical protein